MRSVGTKLFRPAMLLAAFIAIYKASSLVIPKSYSSSVII